MSWTGFALAHNGVLYNDHILRQEQADLPNTRIETDSYVAVQLLERERALNFDSLRRMAEQLEGSYTVTLLGPKNELYFIKGTTPCVSTTTQVRDFTCMRLQRRS